MIEGHTMATANYNGNGQRIGVVFIRKSRDTQDEEAQKGNVKTMLAALDVQVPEENWFVETVSRRHVTKNAEFRRLIELVKADKIDTVYVETQDRWGTKDRGRAF